MTNLDKTITNIFNNLVTQEQEEYNIKTLKSHAKKTSTKDLKKYISNRTNEEWDIRCTIANDELIKRGEK
jgi:hypothetical protein